MLKDHALKMNPIIAPGLCVSALKRAGITELFVTATQLPGEAETAMFERAAEAVNKQHSRVLRQDVFHQAGLQQAALDATRAILGPVAWPVTWIVDSSGTAPLTGMFLHAVSGVHVDTISLDNRILGCVYEDQYARHVELGDLRDDRNGHDRAEQTTRVFHQMTAALVAADMDFSNVLRTWFYNDDILDWYDNFNRVRTSFFDEHCMFERMVPASTGIGAPNATGAALTAGLVAAAPKLDVVSIQTVPSPLQCPAMDYGSSFSRAVELATPTHRRLWISGTASIDSDGNTVYLNDPAAQVDWTMKVVENILQSRNMAWENVVQSIAYFRDPTDASLLSAWLHEHHLPPIPAILTNCTICRDDLLFEIEVAAVGC